MDVSSPLTRNTAYVTPGSMIAVAILFSILAIVSVLLRFYMRRTQNVSLGADDWLILPAMVSYCQIVSVLVP